MCLTVYVVKHANVWSRRDLSAENMRKYWSIADLKLIPM